MLKKKNSVVLLLMAFVWLAVCGGSCDVLEDVEEDIFGECSLSSLVSVEAPQGGVEIETYRGEEFLSAFGKMDYVTTGSPKDTVEDTLTIRISVYCNGQWLQGEDYTYVNRTDSSFLYQFNSSGENGVDLFSEDQKKICPELNGFYLHKEINTLCRENRKK